MRHLDSSVVTLKRQGASSTSASIHTDVSASCKQWTIVYKQFTCLKFIAFKQIQRAGKRKHNWNKKYLLWWKQIKGDMLPWSSLTIVCSKVWSAKVSVANHSWSYCLWYQYFHKVEVCSGSYWQILGFTQSKWVLASDREACPNDFAQVERFANF